VSGDHNTAFGYRTLNANSTTGDLTAVGYEALYSNTTGLNNTGTGFEALFTNTGGNSNTAFGYKTLYTTNNGEWNTAVGDQALYSNADGSSNTGLGYTALYTNSTGYQNTAVGGNSLYYNSTGYQNTACGRDALSNNTSGFQNTAVGLGSLFYLTTGNSNTAIGYNADGGTTNSSMVNCTLLGYGTGGTNAGSNKVCIGNTSVTSIKGQVSFTTYSDERFKMNIRNEIHGLDFINSLRPITYNVDIDKLNHFMYGSRADTLFKSDLMKKSISKSSKIIYNGFSAQEVESAARKLNFEFSGVDKPENPDKSPYGLRYSDFVVPLVKAVQELSTANDSLKQEISNLQMQINDISQQLNDLKTGRSLSVPIVGSSYLIQNAPNPFNSNTTIRYFVSENSFSAQIIITDLNGHILKNISINNKGEGQTLIKADFLAAGNYTYTLMVDGKRIDTKQMTLTR
jgi:hypothetical protein